jgi:hypothetical protein
VPARISRFEIECKLGEGVVLLAGRGFALAPDVSKDALPYLFNMGRHPGRWATARKPRSRSRSSSR